MLSIDELAEYLEPKIWNAWPMPWYATLYSVDGPIKLKFKLKKYNKNCYSYRLYDAHDNCLIRGVTIHGLAAYLSPFVLRALKEKEMFECLLLCMRIDSWWSKHEYLYCTLDNSEKVNHSVNRCLISQ